MNGKNLTDALDFVSQKMPRSSITTNNAHFLRFGVCIDSASITIPKVTQVVSTTIRLITMFRPFFYATVVALLASSTVSGFSAAPPVHSRQVDTRLHLFGDALKGAFANDDTLGKRKNEGLAGGPKYNDNVTVNGKPVQGAVVGQKLTVVAGRARVKIPVNCQKGDCGTCMVNMNGKKVKACQTSLGTGKCSIQTL